ncbi:hypothetical protein K456DRAFT_333945 [Colletotrichum gloeosporioides 23]|nr:hypothetical protein K456DRAFT_333945 [Colletotrichum gloeosporioides 23]
MTLLPLLRGCDPSIYRRQLELHLREHLGSCPTQPAATAIHTRLYVHSHANSVFACWGMPNCPCRWRHRCVTSQRYIVFVFCLTPPFQLSLSGTSSLVTEHKD